MNESSQGRRYDLDWLRVLAFLLLILYHCGMPFVSWDWHVKNPEQSQSLGLVMLFVNQWRLPLLFVISGIGVRLAFRRRSVSAFIRERTARLLLPLAVGIPLLVAPQVYLERLWRGQFEGNLWDFAPTFFVGVYPAGNFSWHHLWFIAYLFVFCLAGLPLFAFLKKGQERTSSTKIRGLWALAALYFPILPLAVLEVGLRPRWPSTHNLVADWANVAFYFSVFLIGFLVALNSAVWSLVSRWRHLSFSFAIFTTTWLYLVFWTADLPWGRFGTGAYLSLRTANLWLWIVSILGFANFYLNRRSKVLAYLNRGVYPFYLLHQTFIVFVAYHLIDIKMAVLLKYGIVVALTASITWGVYHFIIRRFSWFHAIFGLKSTGVRRDLASPGPLKSL